MAKKTTETGISKNKGGRPAKYKTSEDIQIKIDEYFDSTSHPTITGLALALGFTSRQALNNYEGRPEFVDSIKKAKLRVENSYEECLRGRNPAGAIFALKNFGWVDRQEVEVSGETATRIEYVNIYDPKKDKERGK